MGGTKDKMDGFMSAFGPKPPATEAPAVSVDSEECQTHEGKEYCIKTVDGVTTKTIDGGVHGGVTVGSTVVWGMREVQLERCIIFLTTFLFSHQIMFFFSVFVLYLFKVSYIIDL